MLVPIEDGTDKLSQNSGDYQRCVTSQKSEELICTVAETQNHVWTTLFPYSME